MNYIIYSLRDKVAKNFRSVNLDINDDTARRNLAYAINNSSEMLYQSKDLELYAVGEFDAGSGKIKAIAPARLVCRGDELIVDKS